MDKHDTLAHWLAYDLETTRINRRLAVQRAFAQLRDNVITAFAPIRAYMNALKGVMRKEPERIRYTKGA